MTTAATHLTRTLSPALAPALPGAGTLTPDLVVRPAEKARSTDRLLVLDASRVVAAMGVVWFHTVESADLKDSGVLGRFSVAFYTIVGVLFLFEHLERCPDRTFASYTWGRIKRLYLPFLAWTAISLPLLHVARALDAGTPVPAIDVNLLVSGATLPLWFIPFMVVVNVVAFPMARLVARRPGRQVALMLGSLALALVLDLLPWSAPPLQDVPVVSKFLELSWNRWSALFYGVALAIAFGRWIKASPGRSRVGLAGLSATIVLVGMMWEFGPHPMLKVLCGLSFAIMTLAPWREPWLAKVARYGPLSFGLYFTHMTAILLLRAIGNALDVQACWQRDAMIFAMALGSCLAVLSAIHRVPRLRWMIG